MDHRRPVAGADAGAVAQGAVGERARQMRPAVILLSGGLDSATVLAIAREAGYACHALSLDYGQRHNAELAAAARVAKSLGAVEHRVLKLGLSDLGGSALTDAAIPVPESPTAGIPVTYVPARNTVMLALALAWTEVLGARDIFIGVNAVDYSGYPDCRPEFIEAFERMANLATKAGVEGAHLRIHAPLQTLSKAEIIRRGAALGVDYAQTVSCYQADAVGLACGRCDSCRLRREGFLAAGIPDPTRYAQQTD
ncbi:MAG: 7-cyano-7-deazaguanine synthase QueC [Thiobacillus sp.]|nr:7-cyano-7-deazaguanine synthase QueC [Thiobacillus sp.]